jgi:hypothetical protein
MGKKLSIVIVGLASICASQSWAGSTGNGWAQPAETQYAFCYGGNVKVVYISGIITVASTASMPNLGVAYGDYVKTTYGLPGLDRQRCVTAGSIADATAEKQRYKQMFGTTKLVEIEWAGDSSGAQ